MTPWLALLAEIEPFYPKGAGRGRPPIGLERMLRMYVVQQCFGLSDAGTEDALYDTARPFAVSCASTCCGSRRRTPPPCSTQNQAGGRDPQMHQTQKGNPWHFVRCAHAEAIFGTATAWRPASATGRLVA